MGDMNVIAGVEQTPDAAMVEQREPLPHHGACGVHRLAESGLAA